MRLHMPILPALLLGLGTWLLYVADRILDRLRPGERLRERHYFHARHRTAFVIAASFLFLPFAWYVFTRMRREAFHDDLYIGVFALLYLLVVHRRIAPLRLPKELAVAVLFAAATAVPAWSRVTVGREQLIPAVVFFALLCWINCAGIEK